MNYQTPQPSITDYAVQGTIPLTLLNAMLGFAETVMAQREPDFTAGDSYLQRWRLAEYGDGSNAYLHRFIGDDEDGACHDHPYDNVSTVLKGGYYEHMHRAPLKVVDGKYELHKFWRAPGTVISRKAVTCHRLSLKDGEPAISLFIPGQRIREWGFACVEGWKHYKEFLTDNGGRKGCEA